MRQGPGGPQSELLNVFIIKNINIYGLGVGI